MLVGAISSDWLDIRRMDLQPAHNVAAAQHASKTTIAHDGKLPDIFSGEFIQRIGGIFVWRGGDQLTSWRHDVTNRRRLPAITWNRANVFKRNDAHQCPTIYHRE